MRRFKKPRWALPESEVTDENIYKDRRKLIQGLGLAAAWPALSPLEALAARYEEGLKPTPEELVTSYNNFYEFSTDKGAVRELAAKVTLGPWDIQVSGLVEKPFVLNTAKLNQRYGQEERIYRLRCVETWSAVVPWTGFPLAKLVAEAKPLSSAKYIRFVSFMDPEKAPGQRSRSYPWPYTEGLRLDEALNPLAFMATGLYGKALPTQNGEPVRLVVPWKYGFKSIKSIRAIEFTDQQPSTLWNQIQPAEYGFYANVNPKVDHPRWSQAQEKPLGTWFGKVDTLMFNGYGPEVAGLYQGMDLAKYY
ncbi:MAG: protein-methionine-sulfoxide reductase catalytic subunit MsrP [bacterium]|nr:protein-methionine-sulfoxide reductase catalytic subunit MsrP [bacterium]